MNKERVMGGRGSLAKRSPSRIWDDGLHFIRPAGDDHPLPWLVNSRRDLPSTVSRRFATIDDAILFAVRSSKAVMRKHPATKKLFKVPTLPPAAADLDLKLPVAYRKAPEVKPVVLPKFAITHFNCVRANPIAQVWQCVSLPGDRAPVGRRKKGGGAPTQAAFNHSKGECAVLLWKEPVREEDGSVRVFPSWQKAEEHANRLYYETPEDERIWWTDDAVVVARTEHCDIRFDPAGNSEKRPFSIWIPPREPGLPGKPAYSASRPKHYNKVGRLVGGGEYMPQTTEEREALEFNRRIAAMALEESNSYQLSDEIATFVSIWGAEEHALTVIEPTIPRKFRP